MKGRKFKGNSKGQVLGLPMYLIIIMIVAVAVIAAVIFMLPQGSKMLDVEIDGSMIPLTGNGKITGSAPADIVITVRTKDDAANVVSNARIILTGAGVAYEGETNADGVCTVPAASATAILEENKDLDYVTLTIKASGFEDFENTEALSVVRQKT